MFKLKMGNDGDTSSNNDNRDKSKSMDSIEKDMYKRPNIRLIIYEFDNVILTNSSKYANMTNFKDIKRMSNKSIDLTFGGKDRIDAFAKHLENINVFYDSLNNNDKKNKNSPKDKDKDKDQEDEKKDKDDNVGNQNSKKKRRVQAFISATKQHTLIACSILNRVQLLPYFVTITTDNRAKKEEKKTEKEKAQATYLWHVIGENHKFRDNVGSEYLLVLKLLDSLRIDHERALYVGNRKDIIDHLKKINVCHTYLVETKGLTNDDLQIIEQMYNFDSHKHQYKYNHQSK